MEKERKITAPDGCEIEKVELIDGVAVVTFRERERKLPKSWEEFCEMFPKHGSIFYIDSVSEIKEIKLVYEKRFVDEDKTTFSDHATAEAVLALCQIIQLRNCYNGDWAPDYKTAETKWTIEFESYNIVKNTTKGWPCILTFKTEELRDEFLRNFRDLIEKLKPLYGIKEEKYIKVDEKGGKE